MGEGFDLFRENEEEIPGSEAIPVLGVENAADEKLGKEKSKKAAKFVRKALENEIKDKICSRKFEKVKGSRWIRDMGNYYQIVHLQKSNLDIAPQMTYKIEVGVLDREKIKKTEDYFNKYRISRGKPPESIARNDLDIVYCRNEDRFEVDNITFIRPENDKEKEKVKEQVAAAGKLLEEYLNRLDVFGKERDKAGFPNLRSREQGPAF